MSLEEQLREAYERAAQLAPVPPGAYDRFLRRRARRGRMVAAVAAGLALVAMLGAAVLVARQQPQDQQTVAPAGGVVRVPEQGFELPVPAGWRVQRQLTGPGSQVVGVVLVPHSRELRGASITVAADPDQPPFYILDLQQGARRRADGRMYKLRPGANAPARPPLLKGGVGRYVIAWPAWPPSCRPLRVPAGQPPACARAAWRVLLVTGTAAPGDIVGTCWYPRHWPGCEPMLEVMRRIVGTVRPIDDAVPPPGGPPTMVPLGKGGSGAAAWEAGIEQNIGPIQGKDGSAGFMVHFPRARPMPVSHWEQVEPWVIRHGGVWTQRDCLSWLPGSGLLLSGLAREEVASVRIELPGRAPVEVATFGSDQPVPWVAFVSPPLPADTRLDRVVVVALDADGKTVGTQQRPFSLPWSPPSCRPRAG
jgi:putative intracellular protease/amidase